MLKTILVLSLLLMLVFSAMADPLVVTGLDPTAANALALATALAGSGITVDSASIVGNSSSTQFQQATFTGGTGIIPFDAGVLLTSGDALSAPGPNSIGNTQTDWDAPGDADLDTLSGGTTHDANVLTFTFHKSDPNAPDQVSFQYVFVSEEYNEFVGSDFNDVFAFFLNGTNIALVPSTLTPVAINTVNCGSNSDFYRSNDPFNSSTGGCDGTFTSLNTQYDGIAGGLFALPLFAQGSLIAGENTLKLAIADTSDGIYDSGVFLKSGSVIAGPPPTEPPPTTVVPEPSTLFLLGTGLLGAVLTVRRRRTAGTIAR